MTVLKTPKRRAVKGDVSRRRKDREKDTETGAIMIAVRMRTEMQIFLPGKVQQVKLTK